VDLDLAGAPDDRTVGRHLNLPPNFNTSMSPFEKAKWLSELPASLSATERAEQDDLFKKAIAASDSGPSRMLPNANWDVTKAVQALRAQGIEPKPDSNPALKDVSTKADALIKTLPADQQPDASSKYYLYTRAVNDQQRQQFRGELTGQNAGFGPILDAYDAAFHLQAQGNAPGGAYFAWNKGRQRVENEINQAAITRFNYAEVLAQRHDTAGAQQYIKDAIAKNHSKNFDSFLRKLAVSPDFGLAPADVDAITSTLTTADNAGSTSQQVVVATRDTAARVVAPPATIDTTGGGKRPVQQDDGVEVMTN